MEKKTNIWIDTDPGIDDAIAISAAAAARDRLNICGISAVAGNQTIEKVTVNAMWLTQILGLLDVPVVRGAAGPLIRESRPAGDIHGEYGLGYIAPGNITRELTSDQGAAYIYHAVSKLPEEEKVTVVPMGPLTNIALLVRAFPDIRDRIDKIVLMGGSTQSGNITATAEFNIWQDPEAAEIVFQSGIPVVMCGLDVTKECVLTKEDIEKLEEGNKLHRTLARILRFYFESPAYKGMDAVSMHDSVPIMYVLHRELFTGEMHYMHVSCTEDMCRGMTVVCDGPNTYSEKDSRKNVNVLKKADREGFRAKLMEALLSLGNSMQSTRSFVEEDL